MPEGLLIGKNKVNALEMEDLDNGSIFGRMYTWIWKEDIQKEPPCYSSTPNPQPSLHPCLSQKEVI